MEITRNHSQFKSAYHRRDEKMADRHFWSSTAACLAGLLKFVGHYLPITSEYVHQKAKPTRRQRFGMGVRLIPILAVFIILVACITVHCHKLMISNHQYYEALVQAYCGTTQKLHGARGNIYTEDNKLLAGNYYEKVFFIEPKRMPKDEASYTKVVKCIQQASHLDERDIRAMLYDARNRNLNITLSSDTDKRTAYRLEKRNFPYTTIIRNSHCRDKENPHRLSCTSYVVVFTLPDRHELEQYMPTILQITAELGKDEAETEKIIHGKKGIDRPKQIKIPTRLDFAEGNTLKKDLREIKDLPKNSYMLDTIIRRIHPQGPLAAPLVGLTRTADGKGISGIEMLFDKELSPVNGVTIYLRDRTGKPIPMTDNIKDTPPANGSDIYLTINSALQNIVEEELATALPDANPDRAYIVMMKPRTGAIMAVTQYPSFNPNERDSIKDEASMGFLPLTETFEPGSIMKGISLACGLTEGLFDLDTQFYCEKGYWPAAKLHDTHSYEMLSITDIIMHSSNIGTAKAAIEMGDHRLYNGLSKFGFGKRTNIGFYPPGVPPVVFPRESNGIFRPVERWDKLSITRFPIGQGISVTPLQIVSAYATIANHGFMMQPYIIDRIVDHDGTVHSSIPRLRATPISSQAASMMTEALKTVPTEHGTAKRAAVKGYTVAGKTGTSEIWVPQGKKGYYDKQKVVASFVGFVPADAPEFVMLVTFVNPKPKRHGGTLAGPVFSKIAARALTYLEIPPESTTSTYLEKNTPNTPFQSKQEAQNKR